MITIDFMFLSSAAFLQNWAAQHGHFDLHPMLWPWRPMAQIVVF
jgi:hypothetical protein